MIANKKIEEKFKREFTNKYADNIFKRNPYLPDKIKRALQEAYEMGCEDGMRNTCCLF